MTVTLIEKFMAAVSPEPNSGCWFWMMSCCPKGYGSFCCNGKIYKAHRWSYEFFNGTKIDSRLVIHHECGVPLCVNPAHLMAINQAENIRRGHAPAAVQARQTYCIRGHILVGDNVLVTVDGRRQCRVCRRARERGLYEKSEHRWCGYRNSWYSILEPMGRKLAKAKLLKMPKLTFEERFFAAVSPEPNTGCWLWTKAVSTHGYGVIGRASSTSIAIAHRASWEIHNGEIPVGMMILHHCDNKLLSLIHI